MHWNDEKSRKTELLYQIVFWLDFSYSRSWFEDRQFTREKQEKSTADSIQWRPGEDINTHILNIYLSGFANLIVIDLIQKSTFFRDEWEQVSGVGNTFFCMIIIRVKLINISTSG